jgi:hypothetical protein
MRSSAPLVLKAVLAVFLAITTVALGLLVPVRPSIAAPGITALTCTPPATDPEITALARALNYNFDLIYEYVYYDIDHSPTFGSKKGALGTYLDRRGNNIDQNVLFVTLLRQSCITANYRYGQVNLPAAVANLLGVPNDAELLARALGNGGIAACIKLTSASTTCATSGGPAAQGNLIMVWTEATVNGTLRNVDPSLKSYQYFNPINVGSAMGYDRTTFLTAANSGSSAVAGLPAGVVSVKGVNKANIVSKLNAYSETLANYIRANAPSSSMAQLVGGRVVTNAAYGTALPARGRSARRSATVYRVR